MRKANLQGTKLINANLQGADLSHAKLEQQANLFGANLQGARLLGTYFLQTDLRNTDLRGTIMQMRNLGEEQQLRVEFFNADRRVARIRHKEIRYDQRT